MIAWLVSLAIFWTRKHPSADDVEEVSLEVLFALEMFEQSGPWEATISTMVAPFAQLTSHEGGPPENSERR